jgi:hypothetical protein
VEVPGSVTLLDQLTHTTDDLTLAPVVELASSSSRISYFVTGSLYLLPSVSVGLAGNGIAGNGRASTRQEAAAVYQQASNRLPQERSLGRGHLSALPSKGDTIDPCASS